MSNHYTIKIASNQSIVDIAMQEYGSPEGIFSLMEDNVGIENVTQQLTPGTILRIRTAPDGLDKNNLEFVRVNKDNKEKLIVATGQPGGDGDFNDDYNVDFNNLTD